VIRIDDAERVRTITLARPEKLNAFDEAMYAEAATAFDDAATDPTVAVVVLTGEGRAFSAGVDIAELAAHAERRANRSDGDAERGDSNFPKFVGAVAAFPKPLVCAVNGLAVGIGATVLGYADLVFMSTEARIQTPFTDLSVAPEAGSSFTFPRLLGRQNASWVLFSSEWFSAEECLAMGLAWKVCPPDSLMDETLAHARVLARKPIASLMETKRTLIAALQDPIADAIERENEAFVRLMGTPANLEALSAFAERRPPDFVTVDEQFPVTT
jgi:enoyl-CoA hydratase/carnithine racemase